MGEYLVTLCWNVSRPYFYICNIVKQAYIKLKKESSRNLTEKNEHSTNQRALERKAYESLVHTWVNEHDYYVRAEYRTFDSGNEGILGTMLAMMAGMNMADVED